MPASSSPMNGRNNKPAYVQRTLALPGLHTAIVGYFLCKSRRPVHGLTGTVIPSVAARFFFRAVLWHVGPRREGSLRCFSLLFSVLCSLCVLISVISVLPSLFLAFLFA